MYQTWYEVYSFHEVHGSQTIESFDTLEQAERFKEEIKNSVEYEDEAIFIDKWGMKTENSTPEQLEVI